MGEKYNQKLLNGYKGLQNSKDDDYTKNNFINSAFSEEEENAIEETKIKNNNNLTYQTEGPIYGRLVSAVSLYSGCFTELFSFSFALLTVSA